MVPRVRFVFEKIQFTCNLKSQSHFNGNWTRMSDDLSWLSGHWVTIHRQGGSVLRPSRLIYRKSLMCKDPRIVLTRRMVMDKEPRKRRHSQLKVQKNNFHIRRNSEIDFNSAIKFLFMSLRFVEKAIARHPRFQFRCDMGQPRGSRRIRRVKFLIIRVAKNLPAIVNHLVLTRLDHPKCCSKSVIRKRGCD